MSKPVLEDLFKFSGRRNRKSYLQYIVLQALTSGIVFFVFTILVESEKRPSVLRSSDVLRHGMTGNPDFEPASWAVIFIVIYFIVMAISGYAVMSQRCRDIDQSGWCVLLTLVPVFNIIYGIILLFKAGTRGANPYGPDPRAGTY